VEDVEVVLVLVVDVVDNIYAHGGVEPGVIVVVDDVVVVDVSLVVVVVDVVVVDVGLVVVVDVVLVVVPTPGPGAVVVVEDAVDVVVVDEA
jgi:hypothetical protein